WTLWLFTLSDLKTIVVPSTVFGIVNAYTARGANEYHKSFHTLRLRILPVCFWVWLTLLPFTINNQQNPSSIAEDRVNKPWRPLPSKRISPTGAKQLMVLLYLLSLSLSAFTGLGLRQAIALFFLGAWYNNFGGGDHSPLVRNAINACGYVCFASGALEVALGQPIFFDSSMRAWLGMICGIILTTVHSQDMYDQQGDALRGRRTIPLVLGDLPARYTIAVWMFLWGIACPTFWHADLVVSAVSVSSALVVAIRTLRLRTVRSDKVTFMIWNVWIAGMFAMPLL
ncbi:hypothetical protein DM02DRAFT_473467, partial [Periconia macrospinosa]